MRKAGVVVAVVAAVVVLSPAVAIAGVHVTHPRDEARFLDELGVTADSTPSADVRTNPPSAEALIAEGDRACEWLAAQPWALTRTDDEFRLWTRVQAYLVATSQTLGAGPPPRADAVALSAWMRLCPATRVLAKPHPIFPPPGD